MGTVIDKIHGHMEGSRFVPDMTHPGTRDYVEHIRKEQDATV